MMCRITRWFISQSIDSNRPMPGRIDRHLAGCPRCKIFMQTTDVLTQRLVEDAPGIRDYAELSIALDETIQNGGGPRVLGRLHAEAPKIPRIAMTTMSSTSVKPAFLRIYPPSSDGDIYRIPWGVMIITC